MTIDINELRRLAQAATPGPWFSDRRGNIWRRPLSDLYENGGCMAGDRPLAFVAAGWAGEGVTGYPVEDNARLIAAANPAAISELLDRLEAAEKETASWKGLAKQFGNEADALRAKIEQMERQEPAGTLHDDGCFVWRETAPHKSNYAGWKMALYALPGAQGEEK